MEKVKSASYVGANAPVFAGKIVIFLPTLGSQMLLEEYNRAQHRIFEVRRIDVVSAARILVEFKHFFVFDQHRREVIRVANIDDRII